MMPCGKFVRIGGDGRAILRELYPGSSAVLPSRLHLVGTRSEEGEKTAVVFRGDLVFVRFLSWTER